MERIGIIIVAGGNGNRMGTSRPKQFLLLDGLPILARTINTFAATLPAAPLIVVLPEEHVVFWKNLAARFEVAKHTVVTGGAQRFYSVRNGLAALADDIELIAVHDGVRPLVSADLILRTAESAAEHGAAIPVIEPTDTFRETDGASSHSIDRRRLRAVQTPQIFRAELLHRAYEAEFSPTFTDDASVVELAGHPVFLCDGEHRNFKITTPEDLIIAEALLAADAEAEQEKARAETEATEADNDRYNAEAMAAAKAWNEQNKPISDDGNNL